MNKPTLENLNDEELRALKLQDIPGALKTIRDLPGQGVTDDMVDALLPALYQALSVSPDPDRALRNFKRWTDSLSNRFTHFQYLLSHPSSLRIFFNVCGVSQFFSDILIQNPEYFEILANPGPRGITKNAGMLYSELSAFLNSIQNPEIRLEAMRRFKKREILRIGARDILGLADMPTTAREFSNLADTCVQKVLEQAQDELKERYSLENPLPFLVVGMGKLGGQELNYSSDIDLMFVCADDNGAESASGKISPMDYAHKLGEKVVNYLTRNTYSGHLFRVDMRLRPEGRFGALVRSLSSYRSYYESWAESWERQSLLKARPVAGDPTLAASFMSMITPYVYRRTVTSEFVEDIRHNKERIEQKARLEGVEFTNVKIGYGGIRDIEFTVQLLQLELGGKNPLLRTPTTLEALSRLRQLGVISSTSARELSEDYQFLRTIEHRLQILYEMQTQTMPTDPHELHLLARRSGYASSEDFTKDYRRRTSRVRLHCERFFYKRVPPSAQESNNWDDLLSNLDEPGAADQLEKKLAEIGFANPEKALALMKTPLTGGNYGRPRPESRQAFLSLAPALLASCARTGNPENALQSIEMLALAVPNREQLYLSLLEGEELLDRLCLLGAASPNLIQILSRHLEWLDLLVSEEILERLPKSVEQCHRDLQARTRAIKDDEGFWDALATFFQRERLRVGARDIWGDASGTVILHEISVMADCVLDSLLKHAIHLSARKYPSALSALNSCAIIGLGKLGGREPGYGSDWDVLLVSGEMSQDDLDSRSSEQAAALNLMAETFLASGQELRVRGAEVEIDARLRPEGRFGALVRTARDYRNYYLNQAETWEKQVIVKARYCAGNIATAQDYISGVHDAIYSRPISSHEEEDIRHMKHRMETERLKSDERWRDIKLGNGGMSDIEFAVQMWQLRKGRFHPGLKVTGTISAIHALSAVGLLPAADMSRLAETYIFYSTLRNRLTLLGGLPTDILPKDREKLRTIAFGLGIFDWYGTNAENRLEDILDQRMKETRAIFERIF
jgi:glutamate-ammonia-ligase adenylyltransferase